MWSPNKPNIRWGVVLLVLVAGVVSAQQDFQFDATPEEVINMQLLDSREVLESVATTSLYEKEISKCPPNSAKLMLTLVLRSTSWDEIIDKKQTRAVQKLAKFFNVPKESINLENVQRTKLVTMTRGLIRQGPNQLDAVKKYGKLEFQVGCGTSFFETGQPIVNQIKQQMADGSIDEMSGLSFGWWLVWSAPTNRKLVDRTPRRLRRQADGLAEPSEGSGDDDDYNYYDENEEEPITETPVFHPHRHHHESDDTKPTDTLSTVNDDDEDDDTNAGGPMLDPEILESVSKLESTIGKTIENNNNKLKEIDELLHNQKIATATPLVPPLVLPVQPAVDGNVVEEQLIDVEDVGDDEDLDAEEDQYEDLNRPPFGGITETLPEQRTSSVTEVPAELDRTEKTVTTTMATDEKRVSEDLDESLTVPTTVNIVTESPSFNEIVPTSSTTQATTSLATPTTSSTSTTTATEASAISTTTTTEAPPTVTTHLVVVAEDRTPEVDGKLNVAPLGTAGATTESTDYENNYDDDYEDKSIDLTPLVTPTNSTPSSNTEPAIEIIPSATPFTPAATTTTPTTTEETTIPSTVASTTTTTTTTAAPTTTTTTPEPTTTSTTTEFIEPEPLNNVPIIRNRLPKQPVTAGKSFTFVVPLETFFDTEDGTNLRLALLDRNDHELKSNSWVQYNPETREIYGLPLEDSVSKWQFRMRATDSGNETVTESLDIAVQQHKSHRSANHEISVVIRLNEKFTNAIDWQISLMHGIAEALGDSSLASIVVREVRLSALEPNSATFIFTNDSLPKDKCPEDKLDDLFKLLTAEVLSEIVQPQITVKSVTGKPIGPCAKTDSAKAKQPKPTVHITKNYPPVPRNQVDRVNATVGQLLVFKVPADTFYDPEDTTDLKLSLLTMDRAPLDAKHWLQFDAKNQEFFGIPKFSDIGQKEFLLVAEDREGLTATDALVVVVGHTNHRDINSIFELTMGIPYDEFNNAAMQRRFVERIAQIFGDSSTNHIQVRAVRKIHQTGQTLVHFYNNTLHRSHHVCPTDTIQQLKNVLVHVDGSARHRVIETLGSEIRLQKVAVVPMGACLQTDDAGHIKSTPVHKPAHPPASGSGKEDYLLTFVLPAVIILAMLLLATVIACVLHRRRMTGKMEIGDEEERRSFRSKGIPVIFHDELDEKPEAGNKSPVILKDEKPPLLPPSYNSINPEDHEDMDEYVPPPAVVMNGRESRGKSPVTPSYRKPPPYVSP